METSNFIINTLYNFNELSIQTPLYSTCHKLISRSGELNLIDHMASNKGCNNCYLGIRYLSDTAAAMDVLFSDKIEMPTPQDDHMLLSFDVTIENDIARTANGATLFRIQENGVQVLFTEPSGIILSKDILKSEIGRLSVGLKPLASTNPLPDIYNMEKIAKEVDLIFAKQN